MLKWLYPGMRLKRWGCLALIGLLLLMLGSAVSIESRKEGFPLPYRAADWIIRNVHLGVSNIRRVAGVHPACEVLAVASPIPTEEIPRFFS